MKRLYVLIFLPAWIVLSGLCQIALAKGTSPNLLLIMADDLGYSDIGPFGGEIPTPNLDELALEGIRFTNFYASPLCSPTRAMLLSGVDNHRSGLGNMAETMTRVPYLRSQLNQPGYEGYLNRRVVSLAELLKKAGYRTYMAGKWHLGLKDDQSPRARGFDRSFVLLDAAASHFSDMKGYKAQKPVAQYRSDGHLVDKLPDGFYSSDYYTDKIIEYLETDKDKDRPFFAYLAFTAPHWPIQAPAQFLIKQKGRYDRGYDDIRRDRFQRMKSLGLIPKDLKLPPRDADVPAWSDLSKKERQYKSRLMEIYAAMVANMDMNIGRVIRCLQTENILDQTVILFLSDNGAEGVDYSRMRFLSSSEFAKQFDNSLENIGHPNSHVAYGPDWAHVSTVPFRLYKRYTTEGGIRVPAIVRMPAETRSGTTSDAFLTILDVLPTFLDLAGTAHPGTQFDGRPVIEPMGKSMVPILKGQTDRIRGQADSVSWELAGERAVRQGDWKAVRVGFPKGKGKWELHNLEKDPSEIINLKDAHPEKLDELVHIWEAYAEQNGVLDNFVIDVLMNGLGIGWTLTLLLLIVATIWFGPVILLIGTDRGDGKRKRIAKWIVIIPIILIILLTLYVILRLR